MQGISGRLRWNTIAFCRTVVFFRSKPALGAAQARQAQAAMRWFVFTLLVALISIQSYAHGAKEKASYGDSQKLALLQNHVVKPFYPTKPVGK